MAHQAFCQAISSPPLDKASSGQGLWRQGTPSKVVVSLYFIRLIVCTRMCIYIYTYTHMYHLYLYIYIYIHIHLHTLFMYLFFWFGSFYYCMHLSILIYIYTRTYGERGIVECVCVCVYTYIYIFIYLFIYLYVYVYKYTVFTYSLRVWGWLSKCFIVPGASLFQHSEASTAKARCLSPITQNMESCEHLVLQGHKLGHAGHPKPYPPSSCTQSP